MNLRDLFYDQQAPELVRVVDLPADPEIVERNAARAAEARVRLGKRWLCHPENRVKRREN